MGVTLLLVGTLRLTDWDIELHGCHNLVKGCNGSNRLGYRHLWDPNFAGVQSAVRFRNRFFSGSIHSSVFCNGANRWMHGTPAFMSAMRYFSGCVQWSDVFAPVIMCDEL